MSGSALPKPQHYASKTIVQGFPKFIGLLTLLYKGRNAVSATMVRGLNPLMQFRVQALACASRNQQPKG
jgi:hypothetical protein